MFNITFSVCTLKILGHMLCNTSKGLKGQESVNCLDRYSLKTRNILKSIMEQNSLKMVLSIICCFHFFDKRPHKLVKRVGHFAG